MSTKGRALRNRTGRGPSGNYERMIGSSMERRARRLGRAVLASAQATRIATAMSRRRSPASGTAEPAAHDPAISRMARASLRLLAIMLSPARLAAPPSFVARASLCVLAATSLPACLVTSSPSFEEPDRTPPFLLGPSARPEQRQVKVVDMAPALPVEFSAVVRSEDNGADVQGRLVLDYGVKPAGGPPGVPYRQPLGDPVFVEASTLDDTSRTLSAQWFTGSYPATVGCHNVTLFATHEIDFATGCPADPADFDFLSWTVIVCDSTAAPCCDPTLPPDDGGCQTFLCPKTDPNARCDVAATGSGGP